MDWNKLDKPFEVVVGPWVSDVFGLHRSDTILYRSDTVGRKHKIFVKVFLEWHDCCIVLLAV